ncbi:sigma-70 family RNA polymerase sigma factor [Urbifossiella limnaea]|uniref:ECF RNA polymerase sigma factor SigE n=1 Tax=Urbifossiella limnaea TaxID=2528023 RepID=A0A517Y131_9BACT|nr:sigma-70 family RNA polymerase sigma factor [Urbifossiella limnaea]QDU23472.1 ECF RNA polymerase sigma factor SigE [Urbifossiella limnaea]
MSPIAGPLARLLPAAAKTRSDGELLAAFTDDRDEAAFAELVRRHGPVVRAACRRMLPNPPDADDAFQAAFLVLARRGAGLDPAQPLGPWLYRVAVLTARTLRRGNARRFAHLDAPPPDLAGDPDAAELRLDLDAALLALPEKYRTPLVLCHLQGWSRRDAAEQLGCREGTLSSLLARGLTKLKARLRGYDPAAALVAGATPIPLALTASTARAAAGVGPSPVAVRLADGFARGSWAVKTPAAAGVLLVLAASGYGFVAAGRPPAELVTAPTPVVLPAASSSGRLPAASRVDACAEAPSGEVVKLPPARQIDVVVGGTYGAIPLRAVDVGPQGPIGEPALFTSTDRLQGYLAAARTAAARPPRVRVDVWDAAYAVNPTLPPRVFGACRDAGFKTVNVRGRVRTVAGVWREFDDAAVDVDELAPPPAKSDAGGGGKAGVCTFRQLPCRAPAYEP